MLFIYVTWQAFSATENNSISSIAEFFA